MQRWTAQEEAFAALIRKDRLLEIRIKESKALLEHYDNVIDYLRKVVSHASLCS